MYARIVIDCILCSEYPSRTCVDFFKRSKQMLFQHDFMALKGSAESQMQKTEFRNDFSKFQL